MKKSDNKDINLECEKEDKKLQRIKKIEKKRNYKNIIIICIVALILCISKKYNLKDIRVTADSIEILIILYIILFISINFSKSIRLNKIVESIEKKEKINSYLNTIFLGMLGFLLTLTLTNQTNSIAEQQVSITNRETSPSFQIESYKTGNGKEQGYKVISEKGMASYVTLNIYEQYYFNYNGESYEINFSFFNEEQENKANIDEENHALVFLIEDLEFDEEKVYKLLEEYIEEQLDDSVYISNSRYIGLSFFDYKNERFTFRFADYKESIKLVNTGDSMYTRSHNTTMLVREQMDIEKQIQEAVNFVLNDKYN